MVKLIVEGGGNTKKLRSDCRKGFSEFVKKAKVSAKPQVIARGGRAEAYDSFCTAVENGEEAILLVDSETPVDTQYQQGKPEKWLPWQHLKNNLNDKWAKPQGATDSDCHLMVQVMETWFLTDHATLKDQFGQGFNVNQLPPVSGNLEHVPKTKIYAGLKNATKSCSTKGQYHKGRHSFEILARIDPTLVTGKSPWAKRFVDELKKR